MYRTCDPNVSNIDPTRSQNYTLLCYRFVVKLALTLGFNSLIFEHLWHDLSAVFCANVADTRVVPGSRIKSASTVGPCSFRGPGGAVRGVLLRNGPKSVRGNCGLPWYPGASHHHSPPPTTTYHHHLPPPPTTTYHH